MKRRCSVSRHRTRRSHHSPQIGILFTALANGASSLGAPSTKLGTGSNGLGASAAAMGSQLAFDRPGNDLWRLIAERPDRGCLRGDLDQAAPRKCHHEVVELLEAPAGLADVGAGAVTERLRDIEDLLAERGIDVSFLTISEWGAKFGCKCAHQPRRMSRGYSTDKWHLDEMIVSIKGGEEILAVAGRRRQRLRSRCSPAKRQTQGGRSSAEGQAAR